MISSVLVVLLGESIAFGSVVIFLWFLLFFGINHVYFVSLRNPVGKGSGRVQDIQKERTALDTEIKAVGRGGQVSRSAIAISDVNTHNNIYLRMYL